MKKKNALIKEGKKKGLKFALEALSLFVNKVFITQVHGFRRHE